jgi:hypothetical protein
LRKEVGMALNREELPFLHRSREKEEKERERREDKRLKRRVHS